MTNHPSEEERWRDVVGYESIYQVSDLGRVKSQARVIKYRDGRHRPTPEKIITPSIDTGGYPTVTLSRKSKRRQFRIHALVVEAFLGERPHGLVVCHGDGNPENNHLSNLRFDTYEANYRDMEKHGTSFYRNKTQCARGHDLAGKNITPWEKKRNRRSCLACSRAHGYLHNHPDERHLLQQIADEYYASIINS